MASAKDTKPIGKPVAATDRRRPAKAVEEKPKSPPRKRWPHIRLTENQRWVICFVLFFASTFITLSVVSHYFTWRADQMGGAVSNSGGSIGLLLARFLVGDWFGACALCIPAAGFMLAYAAVRGRWGMLGRAVRILLVAMVLGSVSLGFTFGANGAFGSGIGGKMGIDVAKWLAGYMGSMGEGLMLIMCWVLWALYVNSTRTIAAMSALAHRTASLFRHRKHDEEEFVEADAILPAEESGDENGEDDGQAGLFEEYERTDVTDVEDDTIPVAVHDGGEESPFVEVAVDGKGEVVVAEQFDPNADEGDDLEIIVPEEEEIAAAEEVAPPAVVGGDGLFEEVDESALVAEALAEVEVQGAAVAVAMAASKPREEQLGEEFEIVDTEMEGMEGLPERAATQRTTPDTQLGTGGVVETDESGEVQVVRDGHSDEEAGKIGTLYDPTKELARFQRPPLEILERYGEDGVQYSVEEINENKNIIKQTLDSFGVKIRKITATIGPTVTLYEIEPEMGVKVARIKNLENDIAISLKAVSIRLIVPMPGRGTIGIEIPNRTRRVVSMHSVLRSKKFQESKYALPVVIGKTIQNETFVFDLADMPHMIVAGATGQGKSVGLNAIIASLIYKRHPAELKFVMVDPKKVELSLYSQLENHYLAKMESEEEAILTDTQKVVYTLNSLCIEMEERYKLLRAAGVKRIDAYNKKFLERRLHPKYGHRYLPYIVVVIDEFADMIMTAGKEVETPIQRLGQLARAIGIHLIIATQRPDAKVITGLISANCPARMAFKVSNNINSRIILGEPGAEKLVGKGDMLVQINGEVTRLQCAFIDTPEIERIVEFISAQRGYSSAYMLPDYVPEDGGTAEHREDVGELDSMFEEVARFVVTNQQGSTSFIQRKYRIGYNRAGRIMDQLESYGIVGRSEGGKSRDVLISDVASLERLLNDIFIESY